MKIKGLRILKENDEIASKLSAAKETGRDIDRAYMKLGTSPVSSSGVGGNTYDIKYVDIDIKFLLKTKDFKEEIHPTKYTSYAYEKDVLILKSNDLETTITFEEINNTLIGKKNYTIKDLKSNDNSVKEKYTSEFSVFNLILPNELKETGFEGEDDDSEETEEEKKKKKSRPYVFKDFIINYMLINNKHQKKVYKVEAKVIRFNVNEATFEMKTNDSTILLKLNQLEMIDFFGKKKKQIEISDWIDKEMGLESYSIKKKGSKTFNKFDTIKKIQFTLIKPVGGKTKGGPVKGATT